MLDVEGYYGPLLAFLEHAVREGFLAEAHLAKLVVDDDAGRLVEELVRRMPEEGGKIPPVV